MKRRRTPGLGFAALASLGVALFACTADMQDLNSCRAIAEAYCARASACVGVDVGACVADMTSTTCPIKTVNSVDNCIQSLNGTACGTGPAPSSCGTYWSLQVPKMGALADAGILPEEEGGVSVDAATPLEGGANGDAPGDVAVVFDGPVVPEAGGFVRVLP